MRIFVQKSIGALILIVVASSVTAENRVFNFLSPSFGGNPNNGAFLVGVAQAQAARTNRAAGVGGVGGNAGNPNVGGDTIGGPTIIIPINTGQPQAPIVQPGTVVSGTEANIDQVTQ